MLFSHALPLDSLEPTSVGNRDARSRSLPSVAQDTYMRFAAQ
jgi:hypothetical protein